ncbi:MAG: ATP-binding protein, partial [Fibrobacterales bacterium]
MQNEELRSAHTEIAQSRERYFELYDLAPVGYITINAEGLITEANLTFATMIGIPRQELLNKGITQFIYSEDQDTYYLNKQKLTSSNTLNFQELRLVTKGGTCIWVRIDATVKEESNTLHLCKITLSDITQHKETEKALQNALKLQSLGILAGGIAHDFNNLLSGIFGFLQLALSHNKDDKVGVYLTKALSPIERTKALTQQLITFSKGGGPIKKSNSLFPFIQETIEFDLSGSNISCHYYVPKDLWMCSFDQNQMGQAIDNLIINATQAMPDGGEIVVTAANTIIQEDEHIVLIPGKYIKLSMSDHGTGIPPDTLGKIFDPFFSTKSSGHGLGLATCYSIVSRHNGTIEVDSKVNEGTTVHVYLPALEES